MKTFFRFWMMTLLCVLPLSANADDRKTCIDNDWEFHYGTLADNSTWRTLDLPHDWSVETEAALAAGGTVIGPFSTNSIGKNQTGNTVGGEGWYRKTMKIEKKPGERVGLYFEGAYNHTDIWLNGQLVYTNVYGYQPFRFDITDQCLPDGQDNVLTVRVRNEGQNTRWYAGSGIYRHVWLVRTPRLHLKEWGTYIQPGVDGRVLIESEVQNDGAVAVKGCFRVTLYDANGKVVGKGQQKLTASEGAAQTARLNIKIRKPQLWSPVTPYLYRAVMTMTDEANRTTDRMEKRFGIRSLAFSATEGFRLNGEPTLLRGGCIHHDNGLLGAAAYDAAENRKLSLLKAQGFNAVRCSHNMVSDHFLDACDSIGMMVVDECFDQWLRRKNSDDYSQYFAQNSDRDLQTMVSRDRNHPSVIMWSIGNEIPGRIEPAGMAAAERLRQTILRLDTSRPITAAICGWDEGAAWNSASKNWDEQDAKAFQSLDVGGYNYLYGNYEHDHGTHPDRVICGLESYPKEASQNWDLVEKHPYVIGDFVWTAMDYLGEAGIGSAGIRTNGRQPMFQQWPWYNGWCGDIDLIGQKKPQSYYRDVVWHRAPITMGVERPVPAGSHQSVSAWGWQLEQQSWTYPDLVGDSSKMTINVYSRAPRVRLYLNGVNKGEKAPGNTYWAGFNIPYEPGTLRAVNLDANGQEMEGEAFELVTTGVPASLRLTADRNRIAADGTDLCYVTIELVDAEGRVVYDSERRIQLTASGNGTLLAAGNASPTDMESFRSSSPRLNNGRALAILKSSLTAGNISLNVASDGLQSQTITISTGHVCP